MYRALRFTAVFLLIAALTLVVVDPNPAHAALTKRIYITSGTTWTVPADWNSSSNTVELIGAGGNGGAAASGGAGGGGGAYAKRSNMSLTGGASVTVQVGFGKDSIFNSAATSCTSSLGATTACAQKGSAAVGTTAGAAGTLATGDTTYSGGAGAAGGASDGSNGGGAAGPNGGGDAFGAGDAGFGGAVGATYASVCIDLPMNGGNGEAGGAGYEYDTIPGHGSGGGGGGGGQGYSGFSGGNGGAGGNYGAGGGGGAGSVGGCGSQGGGGSGVSGLIIVTYTVTGEPSGTSQAQVKLFGGHVVIKGGRIQVR